MITKICTDIEQSKKLAEILPLESADMTWCFDDIAEEPFIFPYRLNIYEDSKDVPAWSLAALLELIPKEQHPTLVLNAHYRWICDISNPSSFTYEPTSGDNPLYAVFEMILYLHKQKLL